MTGINSFVGLGRLVKDPELKTTSSGTKFVKFNLAIERPKLKNEEKAGVDFIGCTIWGNAAEYLAHYGARGALLSVEGSIKTGSYMNQSGQKVYTTEVSVEKLKLYEFKKANNPSGQASIGSGYIDPDELPF